MKRRSTDSMTTAHRAADVRFDRLMQTIRDNPKYGPVRVENKFASIPPVLSRNDILRHSIVTVREESSGEMIKIVMQINRTEQY